MKEKLLFLFLLIPIFGVQAKTFEVNGIKYRELSGNTVMVIGGGVTRDTGFQLNIPSTVSYNEVSYSVIKINDEAYRFNKDVVSVKIGDSVMEIGSYAFASCENITSITIGDSLRLIGEKAFAYCRNISSLVIPNSVQKIEKNAFQHCTALTLVQIGNSVKTIHASTFQGCSSLETIIIPDSVTTISWYAFGDCSSLTSLELGCSVNWIGGTALNGCHNLRKIISHNSIPPKIERYNTGGFVNVDREDCVLMVPDEALEAYKTADVWDSFFNVVSFSTTNVLNLKDRLCKGVPFNLLGRKATGTPGIVILNGKKMVAR